MPTFDYQGLYNKLVSGFVFGDTFKAKAQDIGVTTHTLSKLKKGSAVPMEDVMKIVKYLIPGVPKEQEDFREVFISIFSQFIKTQHDGNS